VNEVIRHAEGQVAPDRTWRSVGRVRSPHKGPHGLYGAFATYPHGDYRRCCDELDQFLEERLFAVLGVVFFSQLRADLHQLHVGDIEASGFYAADDLTDELAAHTVTLDEYQRMFHFSSPYLRIVLPLRWSVPQ
jgi:hypothetical protein